MNEDTSHTQSGSDSLDDTISSSSPKGNSSETADTSSSIKGNSSKTTGHPSRTTDSSSKTTDGAPERSSRFRSGAMIVTAVVIVAIIMLVIIAMRSLSSDNSTPEQAAKTAVNAIVEGDAHQWCSVIEPDLRAEVEKSLKEMNQTEKDFLGIHHDSCEEYAAQLFEILDSAGNVTLDQDNTTYTVVSEKQSEATVNVHIEGAGVNMEDMTIHLVKIDDQWFVKAGSDTALLPGLDNPDDDKGAADE